MWRRVRQRQGHAGDSYLIFGQASGFADIDLATLTAAQGFRIFGADAGDFSGYSVSSAGDVNGDGFDDLIVGAPCGDASGNAKADAGESTVIFGQASGFADIDLGDADGGPGLPHLRRRRRRPVGQFGVVGRRRQRRRLRRPDRRGSIWAMRPATPRPTRARATVIFGQASGFADIDLNTLTAAQGFRIFGADAYDQSGVSVSSAGDVNGDGFDDLIVGARYGDASGNAKTYAGDSYRDLRPCRRALPTSTCATLTAAQGFRIFGADACDASGCSVSSAGDVNGDGFDDLIVGAHGGDASGNAKSNAGESNVIFGQASGFADIDLDDADGGAGLPHLRRRRRRPVGLFGVVGRRRQRRRLRRPDRRGSIWPMRRQRQDARATAM